MDPRYDPRQFRRERLNLKSRRFEITIFVAVIAATIVGRLLSDIFGGW